MKDSGLTIQDIKEILSEQSKAQIAQTAEIVRMILAESRKPAPENNKTAYEQIILKLQEEDFQTDLGKLTTSLSAAVEKRIITEEDRDLVVAYVGAHKADIAEFEQAQQSRAEIGASKLAEERNQRQIQTHICKHEHARAAGGGTHCVYVRDNDVLQSPGYILCQKCTGRFRPDEPLMRKLDPKAIFDTDVFNRLMQECLTTTGGELLG